MSLNYSVLAGRAMRGGKADQIVKPNASYQESYQSLKDADARGDLPAARGPGIMGNLAQTLGPILAGGAIAPIVGAAGGAISRSMPQLPTSTPPFNPTGGNSGVPNIPGVPQSPGSPSGIPPLAGTGRIGGNLDTILGLIGMYNAANQRSDATDLENTGLNRLRGAYDSKQGLREMGIAGMTRPEPGSVSRLASVYRRDTGNPYDSGNILSPAGSAPPPPVAPVPGERPQEPNRGQTRPPARPRY